MSEPAPLVLTEIQFALLDGYLLASIEAQRQEVLYSETDGGDDRAYQRAIEHQSAAKRALKLALVRC